MSSFVQDLKYGVRSLLHAPGFTALTVLTLTLAIGVNSAIFSMVSVVYFGDLPFDNTDELALNLHAKPRAGSRATVAFVAGFYRLPEPNRTARRLGCPGTASRDTG